MYFKLFFKVFNDKAYILVAAFSNFKRNILVYCEHSLTDVIF